MLRRYSSVHLFTSFHVLKKHPFKVLLSHVLFCIGLKHSLISRIAYLNPIMKPHLSHSASDIVIISSTVFVYASSPTTFFTFFPCSDCTFCICSTSFEVLYSFFCETSQKIFSIISLFITVTPLRCSYSTTKQFCKFLYSVIVIQKLINFL